MLIDTNTAQKAACDRYGSLREVRPSVTQNSISADKRRRRPTALRPQLNEGVETQAGIAESFSSSSKSVPGEALTTTADATRQEEQRHPFPHEDPACREAAFRDEVRLHETWLG